MKRKLVKQGAATMMISLPSKWIKANNLDKGDEVNLEENGDNLVIGKLFYDKKEIEIEVNEDNKKDIKNILTHAYREGFDKIILKECSGSLKEIKEVVNDLLLGFEITESNNGEVIIENISEPSKEKYEIMLSKSFQIIEETQKIILDDFDKNSFIHFQDVEDLKKQQDRYLLFCRRVLMKNNSDKIFLSNWEILRYLMYIQHGYYYLYKYASQNKIKKDKSITSLLEETVEYFIYYKKSFYESNINYIHKINSLRDKWYFGESINYLKKSRGNETVVLTYLREIFRIIQLGTSPILTYLLEKNKK